MLSRPLNAYDFFYSFGEVFVYDCQEQVGPMFCCELKNDGEVWSASAWISTPLRSSVLSSSLRAARSWESPVS